MWVAVGELLLKRHTNPISQINKKIRQEAYTEQSESNPGRSLGPISAPSHLSGIQYQLSTTTYKTAPNKTRIKPKTNYFRL